MRTILKNQEGNAVLFAVVIVLSLMLLFSALSEYLRLQIIASGVRDALQSSIIAVATENYDEVYNGLREGYSGAYTLDTQDRWEERVDDGAVWEKLRQKLGLEGQQKFAGSYLEYELSDLDIHITNVPLAPGTTQERFDADAWVTLTVPLSFGWEHLPPMRIRLKVTGGYHPKF
jgi:hypothetical protein